MRTEYDDGQTVLDDSRLVLGLGRTPPALRTPALLRQGADR
jgi:hypothetical protein